ncbi:MULTISPECIES: sulfite exporter TauE/SafE family protein [unclassified Rhizobium]|uniref:sulfite exporter TauE/SafE family protein n=1 Tax=unclassified Rhizobium TaxID=2613769 RepID=UPI000CDF4FE2|nr:MULTISPECIES: sulfite exporter TauE/SafE family protein [Rhizobium]AVA19898.1 TauE/SafE family permease protein [Rhizobium sp. NXC24]MDK4740979.1 sulfite exporter TauE/SafE family protein [Rhizobium sp. CNPSo 3464]UWU23402.1 sulfite exporter TauE/SafE family protein [Rhizobium tropici]
MFDHSSWLILATASTFLLAGIVKGVTGMGLPTVAMGLLGAIMPPVAAAALLIVPSFVSNVWQLFAGPSFAALAGRLWPMLLGILVSTVAATSMLASDNTQWITMALGAALIIYAGYTLFARQLSVPKRAEPWLSALIGLMTGAVTGGTGVLVIPAVPYLQALALGKDDLIQALGLSFTVSTIALAIGLAARGAFQLDNLAMSSLAVAPALLGMWLGQAIRRKVSPATFRRWFLIALIVLGTELALRPFF